jgi:adenine-specific DNA glycosylase
MYPKRLPKKNKNNRYGLFFCLINQHGDILMTKNNNRGLLANMDVIPSIGWFEEDKNYFSKAPEFITKKESLFNLDWKIVGKEIIHVFTHFKLNCSVAIAYINDKDISKNELANKSLKFINKQNLKKFAVPSLIKKIIKYLEDEKLF